MTEATYGNWSFDEGKGYYDSAMHEKDQARYDDARQDFQLAEQIFTMCSGQHPDAGKYLQWTQQELKNLESNV